MAHSSMTGKQKLMNMRSIVCSPALQGMLVLSFCFTAPAFASPPQQAAPASANYVEIRDYLPTWQQQDSWWNAVYQLKQDFDDVCSDTFCSGEYTNIEALSYRCSVQAATGAVSECVWTFAASQEEIDPENGKVLVQPKLWQCVSPLAAGTRAEDLAATLANSGRPLRAPLPHTNKTLYDGLLDCLY